MKIEEVIAGSLLVAERVLPESKFEALNRFGRECAFVSPPEDNPEAIWAGNAPHNPEVSASIVWAESDEHRATLTHLSDRLALYPTRTPVDAALEAVHALACQSGVVGQRGQDWIGITASLFRYRHGQGLIWHSDSKNYSGAFTYFIHDHWDVNGGGLFLYRDGGDAPSRDGSFIFPGPNRAILLRGGLYHAVSQVTADEETARLTLSGFFVRPERVEYLLNDLASREEPAGGER